MLFTKIINFFSISLIVAILIIAFNPAGMAQNLIISDNVPENINNIASAITVILKDKSSDSSELFDTGSGVIIYKDNDNNYYVLTVAHNLDSNKDNKVDTNDKIVNDYLVGTNDNQYYYVTNYQIIKTQDLGNLDLAVLTFSSSNNYRNAEYFNPQDKLFVDSVEPGQDIYVSGFPEITEGKLKIDKGKILSKHIPDSDDEYMYIKFPKNYPAGILPQPFTGGYSLEYRPDNKKGMAPGMSGGPILTSHGYLIGIHGRESLRLDDNDELQKRGIGIDIFWNSI